MSVSFSSFGSGPAIVFLHGVGSGKEGWEHQRDVVVSGGFRFVAIDAPGFGQTPLPSNPGFEPHVDAVLKCLDEFGIEQAVLCGHSLGGMTAQEIYARHENRVSAMILSATSPAFGRADGDFQKQFLTARLKPFDEGMSMPEFAQKFSPNLLAASAQEEAITEVASTMSRISVDAYRLSMHTLSAFDRRENLPHIKVPTLLIAGSEDKNSPAPMMAKMASKISGSQFVELAETGHMAPIEKPDLFNHHMMTFLNGV